MRKIIAFLLIFALLNIPILSTVSIAFNIGDNGIQDSPWPMFSHDLQHTGRSEYDSFLNPGTEKWSFITYDWVDSSPAIDTNGIIYVGSHDGNLYAINPNGTMKWNFKIPSDGGHLNWVKSSPAINKDGVIYVGSHNYKLYAIHQNGTEKWSFRTSGILFSSPTIGSDGTIYVGSPHPQGIGILYAINPDGTEKWAFETGGWIYSSPAIAEDETIYVGSQDYNLYAVYPNGTEKWRFKMGDVVQSSPAIGNDGTIYVGSWDHYLYAINPDGTLNWKFVTNGPIDDSSPTIDKDGSIYIGSYDGKLYAISPDGTKKWDFTTGDSIISSPAISGDGIIYVGSMDGKLYSINPDGSEKWGIKLGAHIQSSPAIGKDGTIYVGSRSQNGDSYCALHAIGGIKMEKPRDGYLYIAYREIGPTRSGNTLIIGRTTVKITAFHEENVDKVEFYLDDQLIETVYETPFAIMLDETAFWRHTILAKAYYTDGSTPTNQMDVVILNI